MTARAGAIASETHYIGLLRAAGFEFVKRYARMQRDADRRRDSRPSLPAGITIRNVRHDDDAEMRTFHRILETAFADLPDYLPFDYDTYRERLAALPSITWDEWFIAEVDGVPAAILQSADQSDRAERGVGEKPGRRKGVPRTRARAGCCCARRSPRTPRRVAPRPGSAWT